MGNILEDINEILKDAVIVVPNKYKFKSDISLLHPNIDIYHLQLVNEEDFYDEMVDKIEILLSKYKNIYILKNTHPLFAVYAGYMSSPSWVEDRLPTFQCNVFYIVYNKQLKEYIPYRINED